MTAPADILPPDGVDRLVRLFREATAAETAYGLSWYADAHTWAQGIATRYGVTVDQVAGITAALSPQTSWPENKRRTATFLRAGDCPGFTAGRSKARRILDGEAPGEVLNTGTAPKSLSFYDNLARPITSDRVTLDRHAVHAYVGMILNDGERRRVLDRKGNYDRISDAYRAAAARVGVRPHVLQAVVWLVWRNRYGVTWLRDDIAADSPNVDEAIDRANNPTPSYELLDF